jgi:hypothetical protein
MTTSAAAQTTITTASAFVPNGPGELGAVSIERFQFSNQPTTTYLVYSFCYITAQTSCLRGFGSIPNSAFTGALSTNKPNDVLTLEVDTNTARNLA